MRPAEIRGLVWMLHLAVAGPLFGLEWCRMVTHTHTHTHTHTYWLIGENLRWTSQVLAPDFPDSEAMQGCSSTRSCLVKQLRGALSGAGCRQCPALSVHVLLLAASSPTAASCKQPYCCTGCARTAASCRQPCIFFAKQHSSWPLLLRMPLSIP